MKRYFSTCVVDPHSATIAILCNEKHATLEAGVKCYETMPAETKALLARQSRGMIVGVFAIEDWSAN